MLMGCSSGTKLIKEQYSEDLLTECTTELPELKGGDRNSLLLNHKEVVDLYYECLDRHNTLVKQIKN